MKYLYFATVLLFMLSACDENTTDTQDADKEEETEEEYLTEIHLYQMGFPYCDTLWFYPDTFRWKVKEYCDVKNSVFVDTVLTYEEIDTVYSKYEDKNIFVLDTDFEVLSSSSNIDSIFAMKMKPYDNYLNEGTAHINFITNERNKFLNVTHFQENLIPHFDKVYKKVRKFRSHLATWYSSNIRD